MVSEHPLLSAGVNNLHWQLGWGGFTLLDAGGDAMRWARSALSAGQLSHQQMLDMAAEVPPGAEGLLFLLPDRRAAGGTHQLARAVLRPAAQAPGSRIYRAVLEGVALASLRNLQQLRRHAQEPEAMIASGGGARSPLWLQIRRLGL